MILVALAIGVVILVAAIRNSQGTLFNALVSDVPAFVVWAAALIAIGAIGFIPGLKPVSRGLLALVLVVLILHNWQAIQDGFTKAAGDTSTAATNKAAGIGASVGSAINSSGGITDLLNSLNGGSGGSSQLLNMVLNSGAGSSGADISSAATAVSTITDLAAAA